MLNYLIRRVLLIIPTLFVITILSFAISRLAPGDPAELKAGIGSSQDLSSGEGNDLNERMIQLIRKQWNLDKPMFYFSLFEKVEMETPKSLFNRINLKWNGTQNQYHIWTANVLKLDFGNSFRDNQPVIDKIKERIPITLTLNLISTLLAYLIAIPLGIFSAVNQHSIWDRISTVAVFILYSLPNFWIGTMLIIFFGGGDFFDWFPYAGLYSNNYEYLTTFGKFKDLLWHLILPIIVYTYGSFAYLSRQMRVGMLEVIRQDFIRTARAKGLSEKTVIYKHALRNSLIPIVTILAYILPAMIGGSVIIETIFTIPGMGSLAFEAITSRDYPIVMAVFTISAFLTLVGMLIADLLYSIVDPRITFGSKS
ncbi:MAG: ABC transporter permease [Candidatus Marinimicrobia bacterium]|nr:ABC transporter permease [Candidatus Neomarinimicrobiota bacterium]